MNIIVCIKQVPGTMNVNVDPVTGTLIRDGVAAKMNPYDLYAMETALRLREKHGGTVKVVSMGPPAALAVIREAIYMGADGGVLISDRRFGGADVLATSYTLSAGIRAMGDFDIIICGKQTTDGDTAQVGSELAEHLGIPHVAYVKDFDADGGTVTYVSNLDSNLVTAQVSVPCLICVDGDINTPRLPSFLRSEKYGSCDDLIRVLTFDDLEDRDVTHYGLKGSPTQVERIFEPDKNKEKEMFTDGDLAAKTYEILKDRKFV